MSRIHPFMRCALWLACCVMATLPLSAQADEKALKETLRLFWQKALFEPPRIKSLDELPQERITPPAQHDELARLQLKKRFNTPKMSREAQRSLLYQEMSPFNVVRTVEPLEEDIQSWRELGLPDYPEAPGYAVVPGVIGSDEIQKISIPRGTQKALPAVASRGRQEFSWVEQRDTLKNTVIKPAQARVFAGPAVKDGVAAYRKVPGGTVVRIPLSASPEELDAWIVSHDLELTLSLRRDASLRVVEGRTAVPAWLVSPEGLHAATLTAFSIGEDSCGDSQWMEFQLDGDKAPPVWAVLLLPQADMAKDASVKRLPGGKPDEGEEALRSELEVRWTNNWLQPLRLTARRFDVAFQAYEEKPDGNVEVVRNDPIGSAWKVEVRVQPDGKPLVTSSYARDYVAPLSVTGTPRCAPR